MHSLITQIKVRRSSDWLFLCLIILLSGLFWYSPPLLEVTAGIALFLLGMRSLEQGLEPMSGGLLENYLRRCTSNMGKSIVFGAVSTGLMQSSSLVSILSISFLSSGLISLYAGLGIIYGANLGTTSGAWLMAAFGLKVKLSTLSLPLLVFGTLGSLQTRPLWRHLGRIVLGVGLLFLGVHFMKTGFTDFHGGIEVIGLPEQGIGSILIFTGLGILATVIMQSSHASLILIITALDQQHIAYESALALAIGANIGTSITTAVLGGMGANSKGRQLALGHFLFNGITGLVTLCLLPVLLIVVDMIAMAFAIASDNHALKLALFHTLFNALGVMIMVPISRRLQSFLQSSVTSSATPSKQPKYLQQASLRSYTSALVATRKEAKRLHKHTLAALCCGLEVSLPNKGSAAETSITGTSITETSATEATTKSSVKGAPIRGSSDALIHHDQHVIRPLTAEILAFIASVQTTHPNQVFTPFRHTRSACHYWGQTVKMMQTLQPHLHHNLDINHHRTEDTHTQIAYIDMQQTLLATLKQTQQVVKDMQQIAKRNDKDPQASVGNAKQHETLIQGLKKEQLHHIRWKRKSESKLEDWLQKGTISPAKATTLMYHYGYARYINRCLLLAAQHWILANADQPDEDGEVHLKNLTDNELVLSEFGQASSPH